MRRAEGVAEMQSSTTREPIGLLAAWGRFPFAVAQKARTCGIPVVAIGLRGSASGELRNYVDQFYWTRMGGMGRTIRLFLQTGVRRFMMAGKVQKMDVLNPWTWMSTIPDLRTIRFYFNRMRRDNRDDTLLLSVIEEFAKEGIRCESPTDLCPELLVREGTLTKRGPTPQEEGDILFGWEMAKEMGRLDIGQSVMVRNKAVIAVEAIEGTDQAILRAGSLCRGTGFVVIKVAKPQQDMRFDVPTVGTQTIEMIHQAGGRVLAIEAEKTILLDETETIRLADRYGIAIVAR